MSNYPPGMSGRDFVRAGIDQPHNHEHEWEDVREQEHPLLEDGAAIFRQECRYVEGRYGEGYSCEETNYYRFEYDRLDTKANLTIDLPTIENWDEIDDEVQEKIREIEIAAQNGDEGVRWNVHPHPHRGEVAISYEGYTLCYEP